MTIAFYSWSSIAFRMFTWWLHSRHHETAIKYRFSLQFIATLQYLLNSIFEISVNIFNSQPYFHSRIHFFVCDVRHLRFRLNAFFLHVKLILNWILYRFVSMINTLTRSFGLTKEQESEKNVHITTSVITCSNFVLSLNLATRTI